MKVSSAALPVSTSHATAVDASQTKPPKISTIFTATKKARRKCIWSSATTLSPTWWDLSIPACLQDAANHLMSNIKQGAQPVLDRGQDAVVSIILDGENAWEYYPRSGRELLRRFYDALQRDPVVEAVTISEAISRHKNFASLTSLFPGSWINANFNVWIGAPEDNRSWDYLHHAREFYSQSAARASETQRKLAFEEILIAEGSDWNWWYGPEHHSANDREFDELYL